MPNGFNRREALGTLGGLGALGGSVLPMGAAAAAQPQSQGLRPDAHGDITPQEFGATPDTPDATAPIEAMLRAMRESGRLRASWPYGKYRATQLRFDTMGAIHRFDGALLVGIAQQRTASLVDLRGGHSWINGLRLAGGFSHNYVCGLHHYANDLRQVYPGYLDLTDLQVEGFDIGVAVGALPDQRAIANQQARVQDGEAIDAPLSELVYTNPRLTNCPRGFYMRQPNGKVTILGGRIHSESSMWKGYDTSRTFALAVEDAGSELAMIGGTLEHVQGATGTLARVTDGRVVLASVIVETTVPSYVDGTGVLVIENALNNGINSNERAYLEVGPGATGSFTITHSPIRYPPGRAVPAGAAAVVTSVAGPGGGFRPRPDFECLFDNVELSDIAFAFGGARYLPIVRGVQASFRNCTITSLDRFGRRAQLLRLDDGPNLLTGAVDLTGTSIPPFPGATGQSGGGWSFAGTGAGARCGGQPGEQVPGAGAGGGIALRLAPSAGSEARASSGRAPVKPGSVNLLRGMIRTGAGAARIGIRARFQTFSGAPSNAPVAELFAGPQSEFGPEWQPLMLAFLPPKDASFVSLELVASAGAELLLANPSLR